MPRTKERLALDSARRMLHHGAYSRVVNLLGPLHDAEVANFLAHVPLDDRRRVVRALQPAKLQRVLAVMPSDALAETLADLDDKTLTRLLSGMPRAQAAGVLRSFPDSTRETVLQAMDEVSSGAFGELLAYREGSVGAIMRPDPFALDEELKVSEATDTLRRIQGEVPLYAYVVDERRHLVGVLSFRQLLIASPERRLREIMTPDPISIRPEEPQEEAAALISRYDFVALPVVDEEHRLLGVVAVDDIVDMLQERATDELYKLAGLGTGDRVFAPVLRSVRMRFPWLAVNLATAFLAAAVVALFRTTIEKAAILAAFMTIVAGQGGNAATQTLTVVIRSLAVGELTLSEGLRAVAKESVTNLLLGLGIGVLTGMMAIPYHPSVVFCLVLMTAMIVNMLVAGLSGAAIPLLLRALRIDPALASGVIVTTFTDCCGFGTFLGLATMLLRYLG